MHLKTAVGGMILGQTVEGRERYSIKVRYPKELRNDPGKLNNVLITTGGGAQIPLGDLADISIGPQMRRGIAELDGEGEVVGGVIIMRWGENALKTIEQVKQKIKELKAYGVEVLH